MIESMNHIMQEGLKMIFLPLRVMLTTTFPLIYSYSNFSWKIAVAEERFLFQACKMSPGWSKTKKHYDRMMEINYR